MQSFIKRLLCVASLALPLAAQAAEPLVMVVQPINSEETTRANNQPLADYLGKKIGREIELRTVDNYLIYWGMARRENQFDIALDAAHMTSYRVQAHGDKVIANIPSQVSYSLVTLEDSLVLEVDELRNKKVATLPSPGLGAIRLLQMFPNPARQPTLVRAVNTQDAIDKLRKNEVEAAIIPTPLVAGFGGLNVVEVTDSVPAPAISVNKNMPADTVAALTKALVEMDDNAEGKAVLATARLPGFEPASDSDYAGYHKLLYGVWGYTLAGGSAP